MWDTIKGLLGPALQFILSMVTSGPLGLVGFGVGTVGLIVAGIWLFNKYKAWKISSAHNEQNEQAVKDHSKIIDKNIEHSDDDDKTFDQSKKDKENAFEP